MGALEWFQDVLGFIRKTGEAPPLECVQVSAEAVMNVDVDADVVLYCIVHLLDPFVGHVASISEVDSDVYVQSPSVLLRLISV